MTKPPTALQIALDYHQAWTSHDFDRAMTYVANDIACETPAGVLHGADAFRGFMGPFVDILVGSRLLASFGDEDTAVLIYDTNTRPVPDAPGAELLTVTEGAISHMKIIFDRLPFDTARRQTPGE